MISARELQQEIARASEQLLENFRENNRTEKNAFTHTLSHQAVEEINAFKNNFIEE